MEEAKKTLQGAMSLPGVKTVGKKSGRGKTAQISVNDRVSVFLELADAHLSLDEQVPHQWLSVTLVIVNIAILIK